MRTFRMTLHASMALLLTGMPAIAQQDAGRAPALPALRINLVVTPERAETPRDTVPAALDILSARDIEHLPAETGAEALRALPGFRVLFTEAGQTPIVSARGFFGGGEAEYVQLRIDGVPATNVESGLADWPILRVQDISRVEALRGPASAVYGDTALGGVVQVFSDPMATSRMAVAFSAASRNAAALDLTRALSGAGAHLIASGGYLRSNGFTEHGAGRQAQAALRALIPAAAGSVTAHGALWWREREDPGPRSPSELRDDRFGSSPLFAHDSENARKLLGDITYRRAHGVNTYQVTAFGHRRRAQQERTLLLVPGYGVRALRDTHTGAVGIAGDWSATGRTLDWRLGGDAAWESLDTDYPVTGLPPGIVQGASRAEGRRARLAGFGAMAWTPAPRLRIVPALRYDRIGDAFEQPSTNAVQDAWSPRIGATVRAGSEGHAVSLFAQASRAFKAATIDQLFDPRPLPNFRGGTITLSNRALQPQRAVAFEAGVFQRRGRSEWQAVVYRMSLAHEIDFDVSTFSYRNIGRSRHTGVELNAAHHLWRTLVARGGYSWTRVRAIGDDAATGQLKNIPSQRWQTGVAAQAHGFSIDASVARSTGAFLDDENRFPLEGERGVDARIAKTMRRVRLRVDAINLFNSGSDAYGFVLTDFRGGAVPYVYPAPPRLLRAGLDWRF